jgi:hypothetical protein
MRQLFFFFALGVSFVGCEQPLDYKNINYSDRTDRPAEEIFIDRDLGKYDKSQNIIDVVAHDICDCLSRVEWKRMMLSLDTIKVATANGTKAGLKDLNTARDIGLMQACILINVPKKLPYYLGLEGTNKEARGVCRAVKDKCPLIFRAINRNEVKAWFKKMPPLLE